MSRQRIAEISIIVLVLLLLVVSAVVLVHDNVHTATGHPVRSEPLQQPLSKFDDPAQFSTKPLLDWVNHTRTSLGALPLKEVASLDVVAQYHAEDMQKRGYYEHTTPDGLTSYQRIRAAVGNVYAGENIDALCYYSTINAELSRMVASPEHYNNQNDARYNSVGVGYIPNQSGKCNGYWVMDFAQL